jgi:hypothetical protein
MAHNTVHQPELINGPRDIAERIRRAPGVMSEQVTEEYPLAVELDAPESEFLAPPAVDRTNGVAQALRYVIVAPDGEPFGLVEARIRTDNENYVRRMMLTRLAPNELGTAEVAVVLAPGFTDEATDDAHTWKSGISVNHDNTAVAFLHAGEGATEVIGATNGSAAFEPIVPDQMWAPASEEVMDQVIASVRQ